MKTILPRSSSLLTLVGIIATVAAYVVTISIAGVVADDAASPIPTMSAEETAQRFLPGPSWEGKGHSGISQEEAARFDEFPLVWLGESYGGFNLQAIIRSEYTPDPGIPSHEATDSVTLIYGDCAILPDAESCAVPMTVRVEPACMNRPEWISDLVKAEPLATDVRGGAWMQRFDDGHVRLWTGKISVFIDAAGNKELAENAIQDLHGLNRVYESLREGDPLDVPDLSGCPPVETLPILEFPKQP